MLVEKNYFKLILGENVKENDCSMEESVRPFLFCQSKGNDEGIDLLCCNC